MSEAANDDVRVDSPPPSFSVVVPTFGDYEALGRTLVNIIMQVDSVKDIEREVLVVGDGFEDEAVATCRDANEMARKLGHNVKVWYFHIKAHTGTGNIPRAHGLKKASKDWVLFVDAGTSMTKDCIAHLSHAIIKFPTLTMITWDMVQLLDPVPFVTTCYALQQSDRSKGLPYIMPGCATAVKRDIAQLVEWPNVPASDWAYFSLLWDKYYEPNGLDEKKVNEEIGMIPIVLTVAYGARAGRKARAPIVDKAEYQKLGYDLGWKAALEVQPAEGQNATTDQPAA